MILAALVLEFRSILISELSELSNPSLFNFRLFFLTILLLFIFPCNGFCLLMLLLNIDFIRIWISGYDMLNPREMLK